MVGKDGYAYEPVWINPVDAEKLGIVDGDIVEVFNERGTVLGGAYITDANSECGVGVVGHELEQDDARVHGCDGVAFDVHVRCRCMRHSAGCYKMSDMIKVGWLPTLVNILLNITLLPALCMLFGYI